MKTPNKLKTAYVEFIWIPELVDHLQQHDLTQDDFEHVFMNFESEDVSRSSGRPIRFGYTY